MKIFALALACTSALAFADAGATLDGKTFAVESTEKGKTAVEKDTIEFKAGKLHSPGCDQWGFGAGAYKATKKGDAIAFEADTRSAKEGKIHWTGTVKGDAIDASYVWTKTGQKAIEYTLKGKLAK